ncbi:piwi-like protein 3 [Callospermophilus lateralis]|uniref:piwi-like protein 3 n=1 Tax=Callospermophilus lateralis TaxID=76772 RepID=UPI004054873D
MLNRRDQTQHLGVLQVQLRCGLRVEAVPEEASPAGLKLKLSERARAGGCPAAWVISPREAKQVLPFPPSPHPSPPAIFLTAAWNRADPGQAGSQVCASPGEELCAPQSTQIRGAQTLQVQARKPGQVCIALRLDFFRPRPLRLLRGSVAPTHHERRSKQLHMGSQEVQKEGSRLQVTGFVIIQVSPQAQLSLFAKGEPQLEAGLQALSVRPMRRAGVFQDLVVNTRQNLEHVRHSKTGSEGKAVRLLTNHFQLRCPQCIAYKYNVDFKPDVDDTNLRSQLLFQHERVSGINHIFDGNSLLLSQRLTNQEMEFVSYTLNRSIVKITLQLSKELPPNHPDCVRYYNVLFRRLEVLPGYITSILPYENSLTLCADLSHKLLRMETAYDLIMRLKENRQFAKIKEELVGSIVFTRYNNRTYRVDAIDWNQTPRDTFPKSDGGQITYVQYYKQKYNEYITDFKQPLLVSQGRWKKGRRLMPRSPIRLVPQLCYLTVLCLLAFKVVCILPDDRKNRYDEIKKYLCVKSPIPSQCVVAHTLNKTSTLKTMVIKIAQQMNCKMGGALWKVETGLKKTMFVGVDCFHDIVSRQKSIAGFVASTDEELTKWYSQCIFQAPGEELVDGLKNCLQGALNSWLRNVPHAPESIVVYRDGVGDGQLQALLDHEISELVSYLENECPYSIKLTFIVVKKRINTRFFLQHNQELRNPAPGTVVDMMVTREQWYDFYIVSQSSTVGTVTPTHYNVIYDTVCLDPDTVQRLTYKLCHMYYNLPGIIRVPAPCHYAHKLAYLVGQSLHDQPSSLLANSLYYL